MTTQEQPLAFSTTRVAVNGSTDPGVQFNGGNSVMNFSTSAQGGWITVAAGLLCLIIRAGSEIQAQGPKLKLPGFMKKLIHNPGAALTTNGGILVCSGVANGFAKSEQLDLSHPETLLPVAIPATLGVSNVFTGLACGMTEGGRAQRIMNAVGQSLISVGLYMASGDAPIPVKATFALSGGVAIVCSILNKKELGVVTPNRVNALGTAGSAITQSDPYLAIANGFWTVAYISLDALQNVGGVYQLFNKNARKKPEAKQNSAATIKEFTP